MHARILPAPPTSGTIPEVSFAGPGWRRVTWVEFEAPNGDQWAGAFEQDDPAFPERVFPVPSTGLVFVLARGMGYYVEVNARRLHAAVEIRPLIDAVPVPGQDLVIGCDFSNVLAFTSTSRGEAIWEQYLTLDGILLRDATPDAVHGFLEPEELLGGAGPLQWQEFTMSLHDRRVERGALLTAGEMHARRARRSEAGDGGAAGASNDAADLLTP